MQIQRRVGRALQVSPKLCPVPEAGLCNSCENLQATTVCALRSSALHKLYQALKISHVQQVNIHLACFVFSDSSVDVLIAALHVETCD